MQFDSILYIFTVSGADARLILALVEASFVDFDKVFDVGGLETASAPQLHPVAGAGCFPFLQGIHFAEENLLAVRYCSNFGEGFGSVIRVRDCHSFGILVRGSMYYIGIFADVGIVALYVVVVHSFDLCY